LPRQIQIRGEGKKQSDQPRPGNTETNHNGQVLLAPYEFSHEMKICNGC